MATITWAPRVTHLKQIGHFASVYAHKAQQQLAREAQRQRGLWVEKDIHRTRDAGLAHLKA